MSSKAYIISSLPTIAIIYVSICKLFSSFTTYKFLEKKKIRVKIEKGNRREIETVSSNNRVYLLLVHVSMFLFP